MTILARLARLFSRGRPRSFGIAAGAAILLIYVLAMIWPHVEATMVRGSAVTTWVHVATAPIQGRAPKILPAVGSLVPENGVVMELVNDRLDPGPVKLAEATLANARARTVAAQAYAESVRALDDERRELMKRFAANYRAELDAEVKIREARLIVLEAKLTSANAIAGRTKNVTESGYRSRDYLDDSLIKRAEIQAELSIERLTLDRAKSRRAATDDGLFVAADGSSPNWAYGDWLTAKTEIKQARADLEQARAAETQATLALEAARETYKLLHQAPVLAPPGATIRSVIVGSGATVGVGDVVVKWIDCDDLFVDAPISDAALPLIPIGAKVQVILEGEGKWRDARVMGLRGAAETLGDADLAAVAKGRGRGDAQVLLKLAARPQENDICPVGHAAYAHFPSAGLFDVLLARLGLR